MNLKLEWQRLRELDWRELDIRDAGVWPGSLQLLCCVLLLMLTFAGMFWYMAMPARDELTRATAREEQLLAEYRIKAVRAANLDDVRRQMETLDAQMAQLQEKLPSGAEVPSLLDSISEAAVDHQLAVDVIRLRSPQTREHFIERPFDLEVRGDYHHIAAFIADVAGLSRIVTLHDFTLAPAAEGAGTLRLSLQARTYSYRDENRRSGGGGS